MNFAGYDAWKLAGPDEHSEAGTAEGEACNRLPEPDEDAPRNWRPKPCTGTMIHDDGVICCDRCGELA